MILRTHKPSKVPSSRYIFIENVGTHPDWRLKKPTLWLNTSGTNVEWAAKGHKVMDIAKA